MANNPIDLIGYLYEQFTATFPQDPALSPALFMAEDFRDFACKFLLDNSPVGISYQFDGIGLVLPDGTQLAIKPQIAKTPMQESQYVPITIPRTSPGKHGIVPSEARKII